MQPQGLALVNTAYFTALTDQVNSINVCSELQEFANDVMATLNANIDALQEQVIQLEALLVVPTNLSSVISWITAFQAQLILPYTNYATQLAETISAINNLVTAIENAATRIGNCTITIPPIA
jgi:hypothetical protein